MTRGVPTVGRIANGAIIEREIEFALNRLPNVRLALRNADFTTAKRIAAAINDFLGVKTAEPIDPSTVQLSIPPEFKGNVVAFLTEIEQLQVDPDLAAKIVIDERSGIIVMGRDVRVNTVAVAQGNLTVTISESPQVSQPNPFSRGRTVVTPRSSVGVQRGRQETRGRQGRRVAAAARRRPQRARHRSARPDRHPAGDQGRRRDPGRHRGDVMQPSAVGSSNRISTDFNMPIINGRPDFEFAAALQEGLAAGTRAGEVDRHRLRGDVPQFDVLAR